MLSMVAAVAKGYALIPFSLPTQFPSTFGGDRVFYGLALFGLMVVSLTAAMALAELVKLYTTYKEPFQTPMQMHRVSVGLFMVTILMLSFPPAVFNLLWGEVEPHTLLVIRRIQIGCQATAYIPFLVGLSVRAMSLHVITFQLISHSAPIDLWTSRGQFLRSARVGLLCCLIAALVAYAK
jgi:hypothetical protein